MKQESECYVSCHVALFIILIEFLLKQKAIEHFVNGDKTCAVEDKDN